MFLQKVRQILSRLPDVSFHGQPDFQGVPFSQSLQDFFVIGCIFLPLTWNGKDDTPVTGELIALNFNQALQAPVPALFQKN